MNAKIQVTSGVGVFPQASFRPTVLQLLLLYYRGINLRIFIIAIYCSYYIILGSPKGFDLISVYDLPLWIWLFPYRDYSKYPTKIYTQQFWFIHQTRLWVLFDQGRLINLSTMLNLKILWKYDWSQTIFQTKTYFI